MGFTLVYYPQKISDIFKLKLLNEFLAWLLSTPEIGLGAYRIRRAKRTAATNGARFPH